LEEELTTDPPLSIAKGEFDMDKLWHSSQTLEQKSVAASWDWDEFTETVELQRTGTSRGADTIL
jgi:hypothetical protein